MSARSIVTRPRSGGSGWPDGAVVEVEQVAIDLSSGEESRYAVYLDGVLVGHVTQYRYAQSRSIRPYRLAGRGGHRVGWLAIRVGEPGPGPQNARTRPAAVAALVTPTQDGESRA